MERRHGNLEPRRWCHNQRLTQSQPRASHTNGTARGRTDGGMTARAWLAPLCRRAQCQWHGIPAQPWGVGWMLGSDFDVVGAMQPRDCEGCGATVAIATAMAWDDDAGGGGVLLNCACVPSAAEQEPQHMIALLRPRCDEMRCHMCGCGVKKVCARGAGQPGERERGARRGVMLKASVKGTRRRKRTNSLLAVRSLPRGHGRSFHGLHGDSRGVEANLRLRA